MDMHLNLIAFFSTIGFIYFFKLRARKMGLLDAPDGRKHHSGNIPLIGGLAIFFGFFITLLVSGIPIAQWGVLLLASSLLLAIGVVDDIVSVSPYIRFSIQAFSVSVLMLDTGLVPGATTDEGLAPIPLYYLAFVLVLGMGIINALNLVDGIDGLSASMAVVALNGFFLLAILQEDVATLAVAGILMGTIFAFLCFNIRLPWRRKASVFMGDAGSTFLGIVLVWIMLRHFSMSNQPGLFPFVTALWLVALPVFDTVSVMLRRILTGHSPLKADRSHIHHRLLGYGLSNSTTLFSLVAVAIVFAGLGLLAWFLNIHQYAQLCLLGLIFVIYYFAVPHLNVIIGRSRSAYPV